MIDRFVRTEDEAHEVPVPDEPLAVDEMEAGEEPVGVPGGGADEQQAGDAPAPAQRRHHEVGEAQHVGAVEADHQQQPHLLPRVCPPPTTNSAQLNLIRIQKNFASSLILNVSYPSLLHEQ